MSDQKASFISNESDFKEKVDSGQNSKRSMEAMSEDED